MALSLMNSSSPRARKLWRRYILPIKTRFFISLFIQTYSHFYQPLLLYFGIDLFEIDIDGNGNRRNMGHIDNLPLRS